MKKIIAVFIVCILLMTNMITVYAVEDELTLSEYQAVAQRILDEYNISEFTNYQLFAVPDMSLEEYSLHIEQIAITNANGIEALSNSSEELNTNTNLSIEDSLVSPQLIFLRDTYIESKYFTPYFKVYATYDVVRTDGTGYASWIENPRSIFGDTTFAANLIGYKFTEYGSYYLTNNDRTITCYVEGNWTLEKNGVITEMSTILLHATFGEDHL